MVFCIVEDRIDSDYGFVLCVLDAGVIRSTTKHCGPDLELAWHIAMRKNYALGLSRDQIVHELSEFMGETINSVPM
jgi:hypothetical protein